MKMRKIVTTLSVVLTLGLVAGLLPVTALAEGSYGVSTQYLELHPGESATVTLSADNAAGRVDWSSDGPVSAAGSAYLDNDSKTIQIDADAVGTGTIYITPTDIATYDNEELTNGYQIQVVVVDNNAAPSTVQDNPTQQQAEAPAEGEPAAEEAPAEETPAEETPAEEADAEEADAEEAAAAPEVVLTDGNNDYEGLSEEERLYTTVNDVQLSIIQYPRWMDDAGNVVWNDLITNLDMLNGFDLVTVNYKGVNVDTFQKDDYVVFVLRNDESGVSGYYVLKPDGTGFEQLSYISANGKQYIVVEFPADFVVPEGYQMVEMNFGTTKVQALKQVIDGAVTTEPVNVIQEEVTQAPAAEEAPAAEAPAAEAPAAEAPAAEAPTEVVPEGEGMQAGPVYKNAQIVVDERIEVALKGYETVVSPGLESEDPASDIYYIYCLVDGKKQLYSYDAAEGTLQRAAIVVYNEIPTEPETVIVYADPVEPETTVDTSGGFLKGIGWGNMQIQVKVLLIALAVAILLIVVLIILFAVMSKRNKKRNRRNSRNKGRSTIPPRSASRTAPLNVDDDAFFSYVKTDDDYEYDDNNYYKN